MHDEPLRERQVEPGTAPGRGRLRPPWEVAPCGHPYDLNCACETRDWRIRGPRDFEFEQARLGGGYLHEPWRARPYRSRLLIPWQAEVRDDEGERDEDATESPSGEPEEKEIGLNQTKMGEDAPKEGEDAPKEGIRFGSDASILADCGTLGARAIRQFGRQDLLWDNLETLTTHSRYPPVPRYVAHLATMWADAPASLSSLLQSMALEASPPRLILTFLTWGGGDAGHVVARHWPWRQMITMDWDMDHASHVIHESDLGSPALSFLPAFLAFAWPDFHPFLPDGVSLTSDLDTLDLSDPYKLIYLTFIARACANKLVDSVRDASITDASTLIRHIELFNEIELRNLYVATGKESLNLEISARTWARACYVAARVFRTVLDGNPATAGIPIYLPALASPEDESTTERSWAYRKDFLEELLGSLASIPGVDLDALFQGVDLHFYHRWRNESSVAAQTLHIARLARQVQELHDLLARYLQDPVITVMENGMSSAEDIHGDGTGDFCPGSLKPEAFQAQEMVRRICGALATRARLVGWHSWMSHILDKKAGPFPDAWSGMGLREENTDYDTSAASSLQKPSWHVYRRIAEVFAGVVEGRFLYPDPNLADVFFERQVADGLTILSYFSGVQVFSSRPCHRIYVLLLDPMESRGARADRRRVRCAALGPSAEVLRLSWDVKSETLSTVGGALTLPVVLREYEDPTPLTPPFIVDVERYAMPVILLSDSRLSFTFLLGS